ncbi:phosphoacetylglucosamine mutase [Ipomoea triloba]|uniref:phosphoacetylglucosamine mutase n=1 Tax=Ipomoea triloba TaxID=35885 RepID=UPI00125D8646|nr:phosphoacetylglucosamine mutase [Ipomoea triloba]XP_031128644.1 phosphoacetylglucosamine mutase [Ipomoea triloba]
MDDQQSSLLLESAACFPPPKGVKLSYGTSGFRADSSVLESMVFRVGVLAALRSLKTGSVIGLMITASHNKVSDNGVKVADPSGGMLTQEWEPFANQLANAPNPSSLLEFIVDFVKKENITLNGKQEAVVLLGRDTRPSGERLLEAAKKGVASIVGAIAKDVGVVTTPQLHWMVRAKNKGMEASECSYFEQLASSFRCLMDLTPQRDQSNFGNDKVIVDGADGVGGEKLEELKKLLSDICIEVRNHGDGVLNDGVGADFVQKDKIVPRGFDHEDVGLRCASLDGDADRLVYFSVKSNDSKTIDLVDGDKILSLFALFIKEQLSILNKSIDGVGNESYQPRLGVVQTAYANGASTDYLKLMGLDVVLTPTGVKYLHEKAEEFDIGIYFEANGHGTILFSEAFLHWLESRSSSYLSTSEGSEEQRAALRLLAVSKLINQAVGDALSGLLLVEAILHHMGWSIYKWNELYNDLPSRQLKVKVVDRTAITTSNAETVVVTPTGIQEAINIETEKYPRGRCFVRPSGTEDVVRVYAEATTQEGADALANSVARLVEHHLGFGNS